MSNLRNVIKDIRGVESISLVQFGLQDPNRIKEGSVCEVYNQETYDGDVPVRNGLFDLRMGTIDYGLKCETCHNGKELCPGHFGHIELTLPVYYYQFVGVIKKVLTCVCFRCSNLLIDKTDQRILRQLMGKRGHGRLDILSKMTKDKTCSHNNGCEVQQPKKYVAKTTASDNIIKIFAEFDEAVIKDTEADNLLYIDPLTCHKIFSRISYEDCELLGFSNEESRPEWMICTVLPVSPPAMRPSVVYDNQRSVDDLTTSFFQIVKFNRELKKKLDNKDAKKSVIDTHIGVLQNLVASHVNNDTSSPQAHRSGKPLKTLIQRLKRKEGRIRYNIMGKRVDYSARNVIGVDPNISIDEWGIPYSVAMELTYPETVTKYNIREMKNLVRNGPYKWPGANKVELQAAGGCYGNRSGACTKYLKYIDDIDTLISQISVGDVVHRHLQNGDIGFFNRQPTLHKMSMMAHRIRVLPTTTFRLNITVTTPYNADFDGDEMNMHVPQSVNTSEELAILTSVPTQIISPGNSRPIIYIKQDTLIGAYLLTQETTRVSRGHFMNLMMKYPGFTGQLPAPVETVDGVDYWTGRQVYSMILPGISFSKKNRAGETVEIRNGQYVDGVLDSDILGSSGLVQAIFDLYGSERCRQFLDDTQNVITLWLLDQGFTIGLGDILVDSATRARITEIVDATVEKADDLVRQIQQRVWRPYLDASLIHDAVEQEIMKILGQGTEEVSKYVNAEFNPESSMRISIDSGTKGKKTNLQQICGVVGQQDIWGQRVSATFTGRTLPHFAKGEYGWASGGFVRHSYIQGLFPTEFFFHMMTGRTGVIDTAIRTADTGYISRRLMKAMEDYRVEYDGTVRNGMGRILQGTYGDDNFDPTRLERQPLRLMDYSNQQLEEYYQHQVGESKYWKRYLTKDVAKQAIDAEDILAQEFGELMEMRDLLRIRYFPGMDVVGAVGIPSPVNYARIIHAALHQFGVQKFDLSDLDPAYAVREVEQLWQDIVKYYPRPDANPLQRILIKSNLASKQCIVRYRMNRVVFDYVIQSVKNKILKAMVQPGEAVGPIAAQSIGEPSTQMTLNSVEYSTPIRLMRGDTVLEVAMGEFINEYISRAAEKQIEKHPNDTTLAYVSAEENLRILSVDELGVVSWKRIEAVTQHPPINADGSRTLVKVRTRSGREVVATKAKSFLTVQNGRILPVAGEDIRVGDRLPVHAKSFSYDKSTDLHLSEILDKKKYIFMTEVEKAMAVSTEYHWWSKHKDKTFVVPYSRSDSLLAAMSGKVRKGCETTQVYESGCVYPLHSCKVSAKIPEIIKLDKDFGFFIGAYLAEGCVNKNQVIISNNDKGYIDKIVKFAERYDINYHINVHKNKNKQGWTSTDVRLHSVVLAEVVNILCGRYSHNKYISKHIKYTNDDFVCGLVDGYISGDGTIALHRDKAIYATSVSKQLLEDIQFQLIQLNNIFSSIQTPKKILSNNRNSLDIKQHFMLKISNKNIHRFCDKISLSILDKQVKLEQCNNHTFRYEYTIHDRVGEGQTDVLRRKLGENVFPDVMFDEIVSIEEVVSEHPYVYDFTVEDTRNFNLANGLCMRDTFHFAGVAGKAVVVTQGVPRIDEVIKFTSTARMRTPSATIYLKPQYEEDEKVAKQLAERLTHTRVRDVISYTEHLYETDEQQMAHSEDREFIRLYREFNEIVDVGCPDEEMSNWVMRLVFNKEALLAKNIQLIDIQDTVSNLFKSDDAYQCIMSDTNAPETVLRLRLNRSTDEEEDYESFFQMIEDRILNATIWGVEGLKNVATEKRKVVRYDHDGAPYEKTIWSLNTNGTNLREIMKYPQVDTSRTYSNSMEEMFQIFGIRGARNALLRELTELYSDPYVNYRHLAMLCDTMTFTGRVMAIARTGMMKSTEYSPIQLSTFEMVGEVLNNAALYAQQDNMHSASANIMMGQYPRVGTNAFDILFDEDKMMMESANQPGNRFVDYDTEIDPGVVEGMIDEMYSPDDVELDIDDDVFEFDHQHQQYQLGPLNFEKISLKIK